MFYLRVNYDAITWGLIGEQLTMDHLAIPALQRATLICDVADLARNGYVSQVMLIICGKSSSLTSILGEVDMFETSPSIHIISRGNQHIWQNYCFILRRLWPWCWDTGSLKKSLDPCWLSKSVSTQRDRMVMKRTWPFKLFALYTFKIIHSK